MSVLPADNLDESTRKLAYEYWERRGRPFGSPEVDWFAAKKDLDLALSQRAAEENLMLCCLQPEADEGPYSD